MEEMVDKNAELEKNEGSVEEFTDKVAINQKMNYKIPRKSYFSSYDKIFIMCQASRFLKIENKMNILRSCSEMYQIMRPIVRKISV